MLTDADNPSPWRLSTDERFNRPRAGRYAPWLTGRQAAQAERVRQSRMLLAGRHREYFLGEGRTQSDFREERINGSIVRPYFALNLLRLIALKSADLLFGETPILRAADPDQKARLGELIVRSSLHERLYDAALRAVSEAEVFLESCLYREEVYLRVLAADNIFGEGEVAPDGQYESYVRYRVFRGGPKQAPVNLLLTTRYLIGLITNECHQLDDNGGVLGPVDVAEWGKYSGRPVEAEVSTGLDRNTITWLPNATDLDDDCAATSEFDGLLDVQDLLNAKQTQVARVLRQHTDPKLAFPETSADDAGNVRATDNAFYGPTAPEYIVWNAQLDMAYKDRDFVIRTGLILSETSPSLVGLREGAAPVATETLQMESINSTSKAQRRAARFAPRVQRAVGVTLDLERGAANARGGVRRYSYASPPVSIEMQDGLPENEKASAETIATKVSAGYMSIQRAVETDMPGDPDGQLQEIERLAAQRAAAVPSILLGGSTLPDGTGVEPGQDAAAAGEGVAA